MAKTVSEIRIVQRRLAETASGYFTADEIDHLNVLVRLVLEFEPSHFVSGRADLEYESASVFSGVESF